MTILTKAHNELFRRKPDEMFSSMSDLFSHCQNEKQNAVEKWHAPVELRPILHDNQPMLTLGNEGEHVMNDWSFLQLCQLSGVAKETVNKVSPKTAVDIFLDTLPGGTKPLQFLTNGNSLRSIHGAGYTRLHNADLLSTVMEFSTEFQPPQKTTSGGSGIYCGQEDMFCFLIDPTGWCEINGESFAPGFFLTNSEVGRRTVKIETFWFQAVCANHIVWDAVDIVEISRRHTKNVHECLNGVRQAIENLSRKRDERRDGFVKVIEKAMKEKPGKDHEETLKFLLKHGIPRNLAKEATDIAKQNGCFTIFSVVDALTRIAGREKNAGERLEIDLKAANLLSLVA